MRRIQTRLFFFLLALLTYQTNGLAFQGADPNRPANPPVIRRPTTVVKPTAPKTISSKPKPQPAKRAGAGAAELTINATTSGCQVLLNGQPRGITNDSGILVISPLKAGSHKVLLRKPGYKDEQRVVTVTSGSNMESFALTPLPGSLVVTPNVPGARIVIQNVGEYTERVNMPLAPGGYEISVSKPGYRTVKRGVTITPGQPFSLPVSLEKVSVEEMLTEGVQSFGQRNFRQAIATAREVLGIQPEHPKANLLLGYSYFANGDYSDCSTYFAKAISLGEQVRFVLQRHNKYGLLGQNDALTPGFLVIGKDLLEFRTGDGVAPIFSVPYSKIYRVLVENNRGGRLQLKIGDPRKTKDNGKDYNFHPAQAGLRSLDPGNANAAIMIYCNDCMPTVQAIYQVIQQVTQAH